MAGANTYRAARASILGVGGQRAEAMRWRNLRNNAGLAEQVLSRHESYYSNVKQHAKKDSDGQMPDLTDNIDDEGNIDTAAAGREAMAACELVEEAFHSKWFQCQDSCNPMYRRPQHSRMVFAWK